MSEDSGATADEVARLLRQRMEMGGDEVFLDRMTREEVLSILSHSVRFSVAGRNQTVLENVLSADVSEPVKGAVTTQRATEEIAEQGAGGPSLPVELPDDYERLREIALGCSKCSLSEGRTQVVFSDGSSTADLMVVGEAPGANEDETGVPFVGVAGQFLDLLLATIGRSRKDSVYIANVLKCRPPGNRDPDPGEIAECSPFLLKQIDLVKPSAILAVGSFSARLLTGREGVALGKLRGEVHKYHGVPLVVTYHPAALLRNRRWIRSFWEDLQLLRSIIDVD